MSYLADDEIRVFCDPITDGVEPIDVEIASELVDSYLGTTYMPKPRRDVIQMRKNRGKLNFHPVISIDEVSLITKSMFGVGKEAGRPEDIELDPENDGYFTYVGCGGLSGLIGIKMTHLSIKYHSGFEVVPKRLKTAVAMLACNIREAKSFAGAKQMTSLDFQVLMSDDSFFTSDIKMMLKGLEADVYI